MPTYSYLSAFLMVSGGSRLSDNDDNDNDIFVECGDGGFIILRFVIVARYWQRFQIQLETKLID
jgi:hypothetical protein